MNTKQIKFTKKDFAKMFPDNDSCLEWLKNHLYPDGIYCPICKQITPHAKLRQRPVYACDICRHQISPLAYTIFHKSTTPLKTWFEAIFEMSTTRTGYSAKALQRSTGVTYKTAWRMFKQIRSMLGENTGKMFGMVEADETYIGGKEKNKHASKRIQSGRGTIGKLAVMGAVERNGRVTTARLQGTTIPEMHKFIYANISPTATLYSDEHSGYDGLNGYNHISVKHHAGEYVKGTAHTNTIEGFWSLVKRGISGVYHHVSPDYLQTYVNEYSFRYNHRKDERPMFHSFLNQI
ncbi:MAG: IS1595 family transposase [Dehalococcoidia bacterium]|nr:MAG: IS1595 family transposase [Dehalococcoidia bacterium]